MAATRRMVHSGLGGSALAARENDGAASCPREWVRISSISLESAISAYVK